MRRLLLTIAMLLMGMALVGGAAAALVPTSLVPLDQEVGTHTSAAGAVLGIGHHAFLQERRAEVDQRAEGGADGRRQRCVQRFVADDWKGGQHVVSDDDRQR